MDLHKNIMLGTAGHVDHGKTALVKMLTGCNTDTLPEEQGRGLTIDLGFAPCKMANQSIVGIIDVPGHVDFIRNMVAGAHGIDVVIFVVAADDGVMPQTREHLDILTLMGVRGGLVAMTKIDLVPADMRELVADDVRELLGGTFLAGAPICPLSNITGEGYPEFFAALNQAVAACPERSTGGCFRTWVEDVYTVKGFGTVISGIPLRGQVKVGDRLRVLPGSSLARVRKLEVYGQETDVGRAGECVAANLSDIEGQDISRGMVLCESDGLEALTMAEGQLRLLPHDTKPLKDYAEVHLHVGTSEVAARVAMLEDKQMQAGSQQMVQLRMDRPLALTAGDRFVIRADLGGTTGGRLTTIGGGRILSISNIRLRRNRPWTIAALGDRLAAIDDPAKWVEVNLQQAGKPMSVAELAAVVQMKPPEVQAILSQGMAPSIAGAGAPDKPFFEAGPGLVVHRQTVTKLGQTIVQELEKFHQASPHRLGLQESDLLKSLAAPKGVFELAAGDLAARKVAQRQGGVIMLQGRGPKLSDQDRDLCEKIEQTLQAAGIAAPTFTELSAALGAEPKRLAKMLGLLSDRGVLAKLDETLYVHRDALERAKKVALDLFAKAGGFETVQYRDALGLSRKYAVPLLDYFDTIRLTVRSGSRRTPGAEAKRLLAAKPE